MKIETLTKRIQKAHRDLQLEIAGMDPQSRTRLGETREHLTQELRLLEEILKRIEGFYLDRAREGIAKMEMLSLKPKEK